MKTDLPVVEISPALLPLLGHCDAGTRIYRAEGSHEEQVVWFDSICEHVGGCVSPGGAAVYAGVTRAGVHKRMKAGKLTAFCFHLKKKKKTFFGGEKLLKDSPIVYVPTSECQAWRRELEERISRIEKSKVTTPEDEIALDETDGNEDDWDHTFLENDPKDVGRKGVRRPYPWEEV